VLHLGWDRVEEEDKSWVHCRELLCFVGMAYMGVSGDYPILRRFAFFYRASVYTFPHPSSVYLRFFILPHEFIGPSASKTCWNGNFLKRAQTNTVLRPQVPAGVLMICSSRYITPMSIKSGNSPSFHSPKRPNYHQALSSKMPLCFHPSHMLNTSMKASMSQWKSGMYITIT